jgi:hypothetical protein
MPGVSIREKVQATIDTVRLVLGRRLDLGDYYVELGGLILHSIPALLLTLLGVELPATIAYVVYQIIDYIEGEEAREVQGDIVEWLVGLTLGALIKLITS